MNTITINPEGYTRGGATCTCGPLYHYGGTIEPGQFMPDCPEHGAPRQRGYGGRWIGRHAVIAQHRRDQDDELDWIGEWRGRRG